MNQNNQIKEHLERGREITPIQALNLFGCFRLSARIYELRGRGMKISQRIVTQNKKSFAAYKLAL